MKFQESPTYSCFRDFLDIIKQKLSQETERKKQIFHKKWHKIQKRLKPFKNVCYIKVGCGLGNTMSLFCPIEIMFAIISMIYILLVVFCLFPVNNYTLRVGGGDAGARCLVCSDLTVKTSK